MPRVRPEIPESERFSEQINFRVRKSVAGYVPKLAKIRGETRQELFDRLVLEEALKDPEVLLGQFSTERALIDQEEAEFRRDLAEHQAQTRE